MQLLVVFFWVCLISDIVFVKGILWTDVLNVPGFVNSPALILHLIGSVIVVYLLCTIIKN